MSKSRFLGYSDGMKILTVIEFFVYSGSFLLAMQLEQQFELTQLPSLATNILLIYAIIFALASGLFSLSLGLYNPKLREPYRAVFRRSMIEARSPAPSTSTLIFFCARNSNSKSR